MDSCIIRPGFVKAFQCTGGECEDSCCYNWSIHIDKQTYLKTCAHSELGAKAKIVMHRVKKSETRWADIILTDNGGCPFLTKGKLCEIHAKAGHELLSHTCKTYPRLSRLQAGNKFESLSLSCPQAVRCVLFHPEAFQFERIASGKQPHGKPIPQWLSKTNDQAISFLLNHQLSWEQALLAIGILSGKTEAVKNNQASIDELDLMATQLNQLIDNGTLQNQYNHFVNNNIHQQHAFISMHNWFASNAIKRGGERFEVLHQAVRAMADNGNNMDAINQAWEIQAKPVLTQTHPDLFHRYLLYYLYSMNFPAVDDLSPTQAFKQMVLDSFMLRCYLAVMASYRGKLSEDDIVLCFQVYHTNRQHRQNFSQHVMELFEQAGFTDVGAAVSLLHSHYE